MLSSGHDSHYDHDGTAGVACSESTQDRASYQSMMDGAGPIKLYSIFLRGRSPLLHPFALSIISGNWEKGNHYLELCIH